MFTISKSCLLCKAPTKLVQTLGPTPLANELPADSETKPEMFPLNLVQCSSCRHLQIDCLVDEKRLYQNYLYVSDTGEANRTYYCAYALELLGSFPQAKSILDIGSNDGLFLSFFKQSGLSVLGVDPAANIAKQAKEKGIKTLTAFFNLETANKINHKFDLITCNNAFAHNADLHTIVKGVKKLLNPDGVFVFEVSYAVDLLNKNLLDLVYHEHLHHWTLKAAKKFFAQHQMEIFDAKQVKPHGGSIRVCVQNRGASHPFSLRMAKLLRLENDLPSMINKFKTGVKELKDVLQEFANKARQEEKAISVLGYSAKACTLLHFLNFGPHIASVFDDNPLKIGRYSHFGHQILPTSEIQEQDPDYLFITAWNYAGSFVKEHQTFPGKFIVPLPNRPKVI